MKEPENYLLDNPVVIKRILLVFYVICGVLVVLDFILHRHIYHSWETLPAFYPIYGFIGCVVLVLIAKWMRLIVMRDEEYYEPLDESEENNNDKGREEHVGH